MSTGTVIEVVLLALGAACLLVCALVPEHPQYARLLPLGLLFWVVETVLAVSGALPVKGA
jgi:hypothetical protein